MDVHSILHLPHRKHKQPVYTFRFSWIKLMRPMTLTGTIMPILAGSSLAGLNGTFWIDLLLVLLAAALPVQASANMLNDYFDLISGQDADKWHADEKLAKPYAPKHHLIVYAASAMIFLAVILGFYLALHTNWWVALTGTVGIIAGYFYSAGSKSLAAMGLGELTGAIFLGFVTTGLGYGIHGNTIDERVFSIAVPFALLIAAMIFSNNIRDIEKDHGYRKTLAIRLGRKLAGNTLRWMLIGIYSWVLVFILLQQLPWTTGIVLLGTPLAYKLQHTYRDGSARNEEIRGMKLAAQHHWLFGALFVAGLLLAYSLKSFVSG